MTAFSTAALRPEDRFAYFESIILSSYGRNQLEVPEPKLFSGDLRVVPRDGVQVSSIRCTPMTANRIVEKGRAAPPEIAYLQITTSGRTFVSQNGRDVALDPGEMCLLDTTSSFVVKYAVETAHLVLEMNRADLEARVGPVEDLTGRKFSAVSGEGTLAARILGHAMRQEKLPGSADLVSFGAQATDVAALALTHGSNETVKRLSSAASVSRLRLHHAIDESLREGIKTCEDIAGMAGISARYANLLLAQEGTSLERLVMSRRLDQCRTMLADPGMSHRRIGEIALAGGFESASHFARTFKGVYGITAREFRHEVMHHDQIADVAAVASNLINFLV